MPGKDKVPMTPMASWVGCELLPPLVRWMEVEHLRPSERFIQSRARRALAIGEINEHVHNVIMMKTSELLRWCWAEGKGFGISAWIEPNGKVNPTGNGGHIAWVRANAQRLVSEGFAPQGSEPIAASATSDKMMRAGWVKYANGIVMTYPMPSEAQILAMDDLVKNAGTPPPGAEMQFFIMIPGIESLIPAEEAVSKGVPAVLAELSQKMGPGDAVTASARVADSGSSDGPFQQGDGFETQNSYMEELEDGSTAPIEKATTYLKQDWTPDTWWARNLTDYLSKSYPGNMAPGPQSDNGSSAASTVNSFASAARVVITAAREAAERTSRLLRRADMTDPSSEDNQFDQGGSFDTHTLDPESNFNKKQKGLGEPTKELVTRLGFRDRWLSRKSDKSVEKQIVQMEKGHLEPDEIEKELREDGVPPKIIGETYQNREKNLLKVVEVVL